MLTCVQFPPLLERKVRRAMRRYRRIGGVGTPIPQDQQRRRKHVGMQLTQWRKAQGLTVATNGGEGDGESRKEQIPKSVNERFCRTA